MTETALVAPGVTRDALFDGRLTLLQPAKGHRVGTDAVLLAAAVPRDFAGLCYDVGAGVGAAGLRIAQACPSAKVCLLERDPLAARLAGDNVVDNALAERCEVDRNDLLARRGAPSLPPADLVVTNPPFWQAREVRASPDGYRSAAHVFDPNVTLSDWLAACLDLLTARGMLIVVHAPMAVPEILGKLTGRLGAITLLPIQPHADAPANRVLIRGAKGSRAPFRLAAPLVLHAGGRFTAEAERLHRGDAAISW